MSSSRTRLLLLLPLASFVLGTGLSLWLSHQAREEAAAEVREALRRSAAPVAASLQRVLDRHVEVVMSVASFYHASDRVTREEFREFTRGPLASHPSIRALEWIPRVPRSAREAFERELGASGALDSRIYEISQDNRPEPASARPEYFPVTYVEPKAENETAIGFDVASEPNRRAALLEAMATGSSVATAPVHLVQEQSGELGILLFYPIFEDPLEASDPSSRQAGLAGFALGVFRTPDLVADALAAAPSDGLYLRLYDETDPARPRLLYGSPDPEGVQAESMAPNSGETWSTAVSLPGRKWTVTFWPASVGALGHAHTIPVGWRVFSMGFAITLLVAFSLYSVTRRSLRIEGLAADLERANRELEAENAEREQAQEALRASEERFREMADHVGEVFWLMDPLEQRVIYANPAYEKIWGRSVERLYADYAEWTDSVHPDDRAEAEAAFTRLLESEGLEPRMYRIVRPDGTVRWISDRAFPVRDATGQIVRIAGIAHDVTDQKTQEAEHRLLQAKMQHAQKLESLGVLAGGIAHDFNNLLMSVLGNADLALLKLPAESPARQEVEMIEKAAQRAADLTNQLLAYSGKGRFDFQPIRINRLVEEMGHLLETVISKKARLEFHLAPDLPPIEADASQVRQVVMNLITNASEALPDEGGTIRVSTGTVEADGTNLVEDMLSEKLVSGTLVYVSVSDTGGGMAPDIRRRIFDPFFTTKFTGRGLGLAAVLGIVKGHGGTIQVDSEPNRGSEFRVLFPASQASSSAEAAEVQAVAPELDGAVVLIVDDDPGVLKVAGRMLEHAGFRVLEAPDGEAGVDTFRQHQKEIALVLLDMTMPGMDGEEALRAMRRIDKDVRVLLSSGYSEHEARERFAGTGLAGFIQKPYRSSELLEQINAVLNSSPPSARTG
jgi:PAS domain S-box-containing protein